MGWVKGFVVLQLIGLIVCSMCYDAKGFTDGGEQVELISHDPVKLSIAIEGAAFCLACKLPNYVASINASPLEGIPASLVCSVGKGKTYVKANSTTDSKGYFLIPVQGIKFRTLKRTCKVVLTLPTWCDKHPVYLKKVLQSESTTSTEVEIPFKYEKSIKDGSSISTLFTAGFHEFAPENINLCPH